MHTPITRRIRSIVDESLVHCHRGCEFDPRHRALFLCVCVFFDVIFLSIYLFKDIIHKHFQIWVAEYHFNDSKHCIPFLVDAFSGISHMRFRV